MHQLIDIVERHARQWADVQMQLAASAYTIGCITAIDIAKIHGGISHRKGWIVVTLLQRVAPRCQLANGSVHQIDSVDTARRITGVARLADDANGIGDMAFVRVHWLQ